MAQAPRRGFGHDPDQGPTAPVRGPETGALVPFAGLRRKVAFVVDTILLPMVFGLFCLVGTFLLLLFMPLVINTILQ